MSCISNIVIHLIDIDLMRKRCQSINVDVDVEDDRQVFQSRVDKSTPMLSIVHNISLS